MTEPTHLTETQLAEFFGILPVDAMLWRRDRPSDWAPSTVIDGAVCYPIDQLKEWIPRAIKAGIITVSVS